MYSRDWYKRVESKLLKENISSKRLLKESKVDQEKFALWAGQDLYNQFNKLKTRLKSPYNDLYYWMKNSTPDKLKIYLDDLSDTKTRGQKDKEAKEGARLVYSDNIWKVYEITSYEASVKYGKNTQWCIAGSKRWSSGIEEGRKYWDSYYNKEGVKFYFFINKDGHKYALSIYPNGKQFEIFNEEDLSIPFIPDAPQVDEIKVDYKSSSDLKILINALINHRFSDDIILPIFESVVGENVDKEVIIYDSANEFTKFLDENIPDDYLETTMKSEDDNDDEDDWDGDIPRINYYSLMELPGYKEGKKDIMCNPNNYSKYKYFIASYIDDYSVETIESWEQLLRTLIEESGVLDWEEDAIYDFISDFNLDEEHIDSQYAFFVMIIQELIYRIKSGEVSYKILRDLRLSDEFMNEVEN